MQNKQKLNWAILGAGNGGQAIAGFLGLCGHGVKMYDIFDETVSVINQQKGILLEGEINGFGPVIKASTNLEEVLEDADVIMVITPALAHLSIAEACSPYLKDGQIIFLHPGATFGTLAFKKALAEFGCEANITLAESSTLLFACRLKSPGTATVLGIKNKIMVSSLPSSEIGRVVSLLHTAFPQVEAAPNVLYTSLDNTNPIVHPAPTLLGISMIESTREWLFYRDGITPTISRFIEGMDQERVAICQALGMDMPTLKDQYKIEYDVFEDDLYQVFQKNKAYESIKGFHSLQTRYLLEDIPMGLVPLVELGRLVKVPVKRMEAVIGLGELILNIDFSKTGRTLQNLGIADLSVDELLAYIH